MDEIIEDYPVMDDIDLELSWAGFDGWNTNFNIDEES